MHAPSLQHPNRGLSLPGKAALVLEILAAYIRVRWSLWHAGLPQTLEAARRRTAPAEEADARRAALLGLRLGPAVVRTLRLLPTDSRCLTRSLVLTRLLARRGVDSALVIGVAVEPEFAAHAWVEREDVPLLPTNGSEFARLVRL